MDSDSNKSLSTRKIKYNCGIQFTKHKTVFEDLSAELFFELFDYFDFIELCNTFAHLNRRIDGYLAQISNIYLDSSLKKYKLDRELNNHQLSCVKSLKIGNSTEENLFLTKYPIHLFQQLRSLYIRAINSPIDIHLTIDPLPLLRCLTILNIMFDLYRSKLTLNDLRHTCEVIFRFCTVVKTLKMSIMDHNDQRKRTHNASLFNQPIATNIEYLDIYQLYFDEFDCIFSPLFLPRIKSLTATIYDNPVQRDFPNDILKLVFLTNLVLHFNWTFTFTYLESIFKRTPNLKSFILTTSSTTLIDGPMWQYLVSKYLLKVIKFHLHTNDWEQREWSMKNECTAFQKSPYWHKKRGGSIHIGYQETLDEEGNGIDSISVTFTAMNITNWKKKCLFCYC